MFTSDELLELAAASLTISLAIAIARSPSLFFLPLLYVLVLITVVPGFVFHEIAHKLVAERYGLFARFKISLQGLLLSLFLSLFGIVLLVPGAVMIYGGYLTREENGKIALAGPLTNLLLAGLFFLIGQGFPFLSVIGQLGARTNLALALFNLLPIPPLDGSKVVQWSLWIWLGVFILTAVLYLLV